MSSDLSLKRPTTSLGPQLNGGGHHGSKKAAGLPQLTLTSAILHHSGRATVVLSWGYNHLLLKLCLAPWGYSHSTDCKCCPDVIDRTSVKTLAPLLTPALPPHPEGDHLIPKKVEA